MKILLIDDNKGITDMLSKYLSLKGHECSVSNSGRNGLSLISSDNFDVILLDLSMPDFSGYDVLDSLEKDDKIKENKIIVFTASTIPEPKISEFINRGIHTCIKKPVQLKDLLKFLED